MISKKYNYVSAKHLNIFSWRVFDFPRKTGCIGHYRYRQVVNAFSHWIYIFITSYEWNLLLFTWTDRFMLSLPPLHVLPSFSNNTPSSHAQERPNGVGKQNVLHNPLFTAHFSFTRIKKTQLDLFKSFRCYINISAWLDILHSSPPPCLSYLPGIGSPGCISIVSNRPNSGVSLIQEEIVPVFLLTLVINL